MTSNTFSTGGLVGVFWGGLISVGRSAIVMSGVTGFTRQMDGDVVVSEHSARNPENGAGCAEKSRTGGC